MSGAANFGAINWWTWDMHAPPVGWAMLNFLTLVGGLAFYTARPLRNIFAERHHSIKRAISEAAAAHAKASQARQEARLKLAAMDAQIRELQAQSQAEGEAEMSQMLKDAQDLAARLAVDTQAMGEQDVVRARLLLQHKTLQSVLQRTRAILTSELDAADQQRLLDRNIDAMADDAAWQRGRGHGAHGQAAQALLASTPPGSP